MPLSTDTNNNMGGTQITATLLASQRVVGKTFKIVVENNPGAVRSNEVTFTVNNPVPTLTSLSQGIVLDFSIKGSEGILFNVSGNDTTLNEIKAIGKFITENVSPKAKIIFGAVKDNSLKRGEIKVTVIATRNFS